jgi:uncharacterized membrane protein YkvA (DUF1232 family)
MLTKVKLEKPKDYLVAIIGAISLLYLINPTAGIFELIPDNLPIIGNLDEGVATTIIISCLNYFGYSIGNFFSPKK